ncbi:hypothetical protein HZU67_05542 [Apis mellifera carnica]|nr:hypothetical protein HZU67_05542 [Apis mellifera carnica]
MLNQRHYRVNSEEEERDISAKRRKKTNEGVARSRGLDNESHGPVRRGRRTEGGKEEHRHGGGRRRRR